MNAIDKLFTFENKETLTADRTKILNLSHLSRY